MDYPVCQSYLSILFCVNCVEHNRIRCTCWFLFRIVYKGIEVVSWFTCFIPVIM